MQGGVTPKCTKGHPRDADGRRRRCSSRCLRWYAFVEAPPAPDGRRRRQSLGGHPTRKAAEQALREELARRDQGITVAPGRTTLSAFAARWLAHVGMTRDEGTAVEYGRYLHNHVLPVLGGLQLRELQPLHLSDLYARLLQGGRLDGRPGGLSARTVRNVHKTLHRMLHQAVRWRLLAVNPAADLELPPVVEPQMVTLDHGQARQLLEVAAGPGRAGWWPPLLLLAVATGARRGGAAGVALVGPGPGRRDGADRAVAAPRPGRAALQAAQDGSRDAHGRARPPGGGGAAPAAGRAGRTPPRLRRRLPHRRGPGGLQGGWGPAASRARLR